MLQTGLEEDMLMRMLGDQRGTLAMEIGLTAALVGGAALIAILSVALI
jgi:hypothetical protein